MRLWHTAAKTRAVFDDPNLVSHAGLVLAVRLASDAGLEELVTEHVRVAARTGANPGVMIGSLVAGMIVGADSLDGMDLLRHGAIPATFGGIRAPSTLGGCRASKQGAAFGHAKIASKSLLVRGLNALMATVSTPLAAPVVAAAWLRGDNADSARGAATLLAEALGTAREAGATGLIVVRADSAYYAGAFVAACRRGVTIRTELIQVASRPARSGRDQITWHLPEEWPWQDACRAPSRPPIGRPSPGRLN
jgi:hypothetical protein